MNKLDQERRREAIKGLVNIAIFEAFLLFAVIGVYFYIGDIRYLIGGVIAVMILTAPMLLRHIAANKDALGQKNAAEKDPYSTSGPDL